jgi:hypothetical protein
MGPKKGKKDVKNHEDHRGIRLAKRTDLMNKEDKISEGAKKDKIKKKKTRFTITKKGKKIFFFVFHCVFNFWQYLSQSLVCERKV